MQLEISKYYFSHNFYWSLAKLYENTGYYGKSKYLLETAMRSWHLVPKITFYLKYSCVLGLQFKQIIKALGLLVFIFVTMGPYASKNFKTLLLQFSSDLCQTL